MIPSDQPNAFATGRNPEHAAVAVTQGLLQLMPRDQVRGVLAHEFAHIKNRDILVSSIAAMIAGAISAIGNIFFFTGIFGDDDDNPLGLSARCARSSSRRSRRRCSSSPSRDSASTSPTRPPRGARRGASRSPRRSRPSSAAGRSLPMQVNPATASLYIVNPLSGGGHDGALLDASADRGADQRGCANTTSAPGLTARRLRGTARFRGAPWPEGLRSGRSPESEAVAGRRRLSTPTSTSSSRGPSATCPSASGRSTSTGSIPYLGKFIPQLVETLLDRYVPAGGRVFDPFAGSGTTLVQSLESGRDATGVDVAAFNCLLMRVKTARYNEFVLEKDIRDALSRLESRDVPRHCPRGHGYVRQWFAPQAAAELLAFGVADRRLRARRCASRRARTGGTLGPPDRALRPRLPA